jgi:UDP-2,3-diacylglucosamine hydrolase
MTGLDDPTVLDFLGQRWLLSHGDALCLEDTDYQRFRREVRSPAWQQAFLARPLPEREALAGDMRARSETRKQALGNDPVLWADVDPDAAHQALQQANACTLIHGHTHRPARHTLGSGERGQALQRIVLSDWDLRARPKRAEVLRLDAQGLKRLPLDTICAD